MLFQLFKDERIGSFRGYIWNRTFPILTQNMLIGSGSDIFPLIFPQDDIGGKFNSGINPYLLVDKPHNAYLQFWVSHGFIALLICTWIVGMALIGKARQGESIKTTNMMCFGLQGAVIGFVFVSLLNDTVVYVTPIYIIMVGILLNLKKPSTGMY